MTDVPRECRLFTPDASYRGKQGFDYLHGISAESAGSRGICMHLLEIPPGGRAKAHQHDAHETAIYALEGETEMSWGERLEHHMTVPEGALLYIPAGVPHLPMNRTDRVAKAIIARTDPNEQESVTLREDLEGMVG